MAFSYATNLANRLRDLQAKNTLTPVRPLGGTTTYAPSYSGGQASEFYKPPTQTTAPPPPPRLSDSVSLEPGLSYGGPIGVGTSAFRTPTSFGTRTPMTLTSTPAPTYSTGGGGGGYSSGGGGWGGSGGGGGTGAGIPASNVSEPLTGFAARYQPGGIQEVLDNPGVIARDVLDMLGINSDSLGNLYSQNAQYFVSQILPLLYGQDAIGSMPTAGGMVNRTADYLQNLSTPGGATINPMEILRMVLAEASKPSTGPQTVLSGLFAGQTPGQQVSSMSRIGSNLSNWTPNEMMGQSLRNWIARQGEEYLRQSLRANQPYTNPFGSFLSPSVLPE